MNQGLARGLGLVGALVVLNIVSYVFHWGFFFY
jgi:hypothetical protein